ncbi:MAG: efflux RND transporter periplasmic adaptor subunit [Muribaculaceae bacterium]|nr:efflux RND transporter periplasmic adaptor subunit [Muribaculaceae bacterium]
MKYGYSLLSAVLLPLMAAGCHGSHSHEAAEAHEEGGAHSGHDHGDLIMLDPHMAGRLGVTVAKVEPGDFAEVIRATGVLERAAEGTATAVAPVGGTVTVAAGITPGVRVSRGQSLASVDARAVSGGDTEAAARAELAAAERELERVEALWRQRLVTAAEHSAAVAAAERARAAVSRSGSSVTAPAGGTVVSVDAPQGGYVSAGDAVVTIAPDGPLTLRADVPSRHYRALGTLTDARFSLGYGSDALTVSALGGKRLGDMAAATTSGYLPVYFTIPAGAELPAGASADVWLLGSVRHGVISVPLEALSEQQGRYFVYRAVHPDEGGYAKQPVTIGATDGMRAEITSGLSGGENIVTSGTTAVRLAEMQSVVPEGHSHNH